MEEQQGMDEEGQGMPIRPPREGEAGSGDSMSGAAAEPASGEGGEMPPAKRTTAAEMSGNESPQVGEMPS